jgi:SAM-dependent methyltransferase
MSDRHSATTPGLVPVPVAVFLPRPDHAWPVPADLSADGAWCGITAPNIASLVAWYTKPGDLIADLDGHPLVARAAAFLDRRPVTPTHPPVPHRMSRGGRGLLFARLPRDGADSADLTAMTTAMHAWRRRLRPGGWLVTALTTAIDEDGLVSHRSTVITAARTAGLSWRQEFLVVLDSLPEFEPRAMPGTAAGTRPRWWTGDTPSTTTRRSRSAGPPEAAMPDRHTRTNPTITSTGPDHAKRVRRLGAAPAPEVQGSVFVTGQVCSREQRRGRYTPESMAHPAKMLPSIPRYLIATFTEPGDHVWDPMAGIASTVVEAMWLGRHGIGIEYEPHWVDLAAANIRLATEQGAPGTGRIIHGDARDLPELVPAALHGRVALVITSPPYGPATHGHVRTPGPRRGKVRKVHHRYGDDPGNLAYQHPDDLAEGFTRILRGVAQVLRPGGILAVTARPYHDRDELVDIPGMVAAAGINAGLRLHEDAAALIGGIRDGRLIPRGSFFQQRNIRAAIERGDPQFLGQSEDVVLMYRVPAARRVPGTRLPPTAKGARRGPDRRPAATRESVTAHGPGR